MCLFSLKKFRESNWVSVTQCGKVQLNLNAITLKFFTWNYLFSNSFRKIVDLREKVQCRFFHRNSWLRLIVLFHTVLFIVQLRYFLIFTKYFSSGGQNSYLTIPWVNWSFAFSTFRELLTKLNHIIIFNQKFCEITKEPKTLQFVDFDF